MVKNGTLASPAMARASSVLPVPGGPTSSTPRGMRPPSRWNFCGSRRNSTISCEVFLGLVDAGDVLEGDAAMRLGEQLRLRLAEAERLAAGPLHLAHEEDPHGEDQEHREPGDQHADQRLAALGRRLGGDRDAAVLEALDEVGILRREGLEGAAVGVDAGDLLAGDDDVADLALVDVGQELRIGDVAGRRRAGRNSGRG